MRPPNGESLEMCLERAVTYFKDEVSPNDALMLMFFESVWII